MISKSEIYEALAYVYDPEIPRLSILDLGMIENVQVQGTDVEVTMLPTFSGCPAIDVLKQSISTSVKSVQHVENVTVKVSFEVPWNSDRITEHGRKVLKQSGFAPPHIHGGTFQIGLLTNVECPFCESTNTVLQSPFGPTLCRAIHFCNDCKQAFEQFKPVE